MGSMISPILQMRNLKYRDVKKPAYGQSTIRSTVSILTWAGQNLCPQQLLHSLSRHYLSSRTILGGR